jgi:hypothetical protein
MEAYRRGYVADFCESVKSGGFFVAVAVAVAVDAFEISPEVEEGFIGGKKLSKMSEVSSFFDFRERLRTDSKAAHVYAS